MVTRNVPAGTKISEKHIQNNSQPTEKIAHQNSVKGRADAILSGDKACLYTLNLTASIYIQISQNGEGQAFTLENDHKEKAHKGGKSSSENAIARGWNARGKDSGLSSSARRKIRIVSDCYHALVTNKEFYDRHYLEDNLFNSYCRFITLTFRQYIPEDREAKKLLDNFFKRLRRYKGRNFHYVWVAEVQAKRKKKTGVRAIHFHILTPEKIYEDSIDDSTKKIRLEENKWVNRVWNEVVANWALKKGYVSKGMYKDWMNEYEMSERYYEKLVEYRLNGGACPRRPKKSVYMLLPNCVHVANAGRYMCKYMSKDGEHIVGGMYDISKESRSFLPKRKLVCKEVRGVFFGNKIIEYMRFRAVQESVFTSNWELKFNESSGIWCKDAYKLLEWYYEFVEAEKIDPKIWMREFR